MKKLTLVVLVAALTIIISAKAQEKTNVSRDLTSVKEEVVESYQAPRVHEYKLQLYK